jgi:hypothetical protein
MVDICGKPIVLAAVSMPACFAFRSQLPVLWPVPGSNGLPLLPAKTCGSRLEPFEPPLVLLTFDILPNEFALPVRFALFSRLARERNEG